MKRVRNAECGMENKNESNTGHDIRSAESTPQSAIRIPQSNVPQSAFRNPQSNAPQLKGRTKKFALDVIRLVEGLPPSYAGQVIGRQLFRSGTSVGANYRAACRAKSVADFIAKMGIVEEEADECMYWMELLDETQLVPSVKLKALMAEADDIVAITVASISSAKENKK